MKQFIIALFVVSLALTACGGDESSTGGTGGGGTASGGGSGGGGGSASGSFGSANVAACKSLYQSLKCGVFDYSSQVSTCDSYANLVCDVSAYFRCVSSHYVCSNGTYDATKLSTVSECASKSTCQ